jgi:hypothetical protein
LSAYNHAAGIDSGSVKEKGGSPDSVAELYRGSPQIWE